MFKSEVSSEEIEKLEYKSFPGEIIFIDELGKDFYSAIRYLKKQNVIGFDTESKPSFVKGEPRNQVAILQLSGAGKAFLFRVKSIGMPHKLCSILESDRIIKVGAAVKDDIRGLQKYTKFKPQRFIDLQTFVDKYGITQKSVKKMAAIILNVKISKSQQVSNWELKPLSTSQLLYAATDAWVCREMYKRLLKEDKEEKDGKSNIKKG